MNKNHRHWRARMTLVKGSTLIGAMVSILIMSIGMAALFKLYINNTLNSAHSRHVSTALAFARDKIEALRFDSNSTTMALKSGGEQLQDQTIRYQRSWQIVKNSKPDYRHIRVSMQWQDSSGDHNITLNTLISDPSADGLPFSEP